MFVQRVVEISAVRDDMFDDRQRENNDLIGEFCLLASLHCSMCSSHCYMVGGTCLCVSVCLLTRLTQITTATLADLQELIIHRGSVQGKFHEIWRFGRKVSIERQFFHEDCKGMSRETVHRILQVSVWMPKQDGE